ncbi:MAG: hypothetical protein HKN92_12025 [Chitinophagales bacterium]|nr:hypothetical protein [Chitinophagales bacterium]
MYKITLLSLFLTFLLLISCSDNNVGEFDGFYKGTLTAEVESVEIFYGDTVVTNYTKAETFDLRIKGDRYFTRNRKGDFFVLNENEFLFDLEVNNCFYGCEAILDDTMSFQSEAHVLVLEDQIKYTQFYFSVVNVTEDRVFNLVRN